MWPQGTSLLQRTRILGGNVLSKALAALALAASCLVIGIQASPASIKTSLAAAESSPWYDTNANAADSRANLTEHVLSPSAVPKIKYLRSIVSPLPPPRALCPQSIVAPVLVGGYLYAVSDGQVSKYNPATGTLIWRSNPDPTISTWAFRSLAVSGSLLVAGAEGCQSASQPGGEVFAYNTATGALVWKATAPSGLTEAVIATSYVIASGVDAAGSQVEVFNLSTGQVAWSDFGCAGGTDRPLVVSLLVMWYGCDTQGNAKLEASNLATGTVVWSLPTGWTIQRGDLSGSAGTHLYLTNASGTVVDVNPQNGQAQYSLSGAANVVAVDASRVYASCGSQAVCAYNIGTGALEWQKDGLGFAPAVPAEADGVLYMDDGKALNAATGQVIGQVWQEIDVYYYQTASAIAIGDGRIAVVANPRVLDLFGLPGY